MTTVSFIVLLFEVLSLAFLAVCVVEYRVLMRRHVAFFQGISNGEHGRVERRSGVLLWVYIGMTIFVTIMTTFVFIFQPHIL